MASSKYNTQMVATLSAHISTGRHLSNTTLCRHRSTQRLSDQRRHIKVSLISQDHLRSRNKIVETYSIFVLNSQELHDCQREANITSEKWYVYLDESFLHPSILNELSTYKSFLLYLIKLLQLSDNSTIGGLNRTDILNGTEPSNWYDYWSSSSKPVMTPTPQPSNKPTTAPTNELFQSTPTVAPTQLLGKRGSSSNVENYELMSTMTVLFFLVFVAVAFYVTKRYFLKKKKTKSKIMIASPFFCQLRGRVKERRKLMEDYFVVDAAECGILHRSAASSVDLQISTEFINISSENQQ